MLAVQLASRITAGDNVKFHLPGGRVIAGAVSRPTYSGGNVDAQTSYLVTSNGHTSLVDVDTVIAVTIDHAS